LAASRGSSGFATQHRRNTKVVGRRADDQWLIEVTWLICTVWPPTVSVGGVALVLTALITP
jgi:hypothetical protein